jgi:hypothetical protein
MMEHELRTRRSALVLAAGAFAVPALAAAGGAITALAPLERGRWEVRDLDSGRSRPAVCLGNPAQLVQLEHRGANCPLEVLQNEKGEATAQYSCAGRGFGHTHIRVDTPRLVRIDTQGLSNGRPFSFRLEAKRAGNC